jgi:hypothetical protein
MFVWVAVVEVALGSCMPVAVFTLVGGGKLVSVGILQPTQVGAPDDSAFAVALVLAMTATTATIDKTPAAAPRKKVRRR